MFYVFYDTLQQKCQNQKAINIETSELFSFSLLTLNFDVFQMKLKTMVSALTGVYVSYRTHSLK